jgi:hypothetical protein
VKHDIVRKPKLVAALALAVLVSGIAATTGAATSGQATNDNHYTVHNLVSDGFVPADDDSDSNLVNAWGIAASSTSPW